MASGLRHVRDDSPGISRRRRGAGYSFHFPDGTIVRDPAVRRRLLALAIPPAWSEVWISPDPAGHIQATGRDSRGRKQYVYHPRWRELRDRTKYDRLVALGRVLPAMRRRVLRDLGRSGLGRERVLAAVVRLLDRAAMRIGSEEYRRANGSYGATTLRKRHVELDSSRLCFRYRAKGGVLREVCVTDRRAARVVARCQELPGQELFQYLDDEGEPRSIDSGDVNDYLRSISGGDFTAKDIRTWQGTVEAAASLWERGPAADGGEVASAVLEAVDRAASALGNTRAVTRSFYVHPAVLEAYGRGDLRPAPEEVDERPEHLSPQEAALLAFLEGGAGRAA